MPPLCAVFGKDNHFLSENANKIQCNFGFAPPAGLRLAAQACQNIKTKPVESGLNCGRFFPRSTVCGE